MFKQIIDISRPIQFEMTVYPGDTPFLVKQSLAFSKGDCCNLSSFEMSMHLGTHIDAPLHFIPEGKSVAELSPELFCGKVRVILLEVNGQITARDLADINWEGIERLLLKIPTNESLLNLKEFSNDFVGLDLTAAEFLLGKGIRLVGIEGLSIENDVDSTYPVHKLLLQHGIVILEGIDLREVDSGEYILVCPPLKLEEGNGSPVRAMLLRLE